MKQFLSFVRKEFYHILRDRRTLLILLGIPIVQIILFGFAISTEVKDVRVAFFDPSNDVATQHIIERFKANNYFTMIQMIDSPAEIERLFLENRINLAVVFQERFNENLLHTGTASVQLISDGTDPNTALMLTNYASNIIASYQQESLAAGLPSMQILSQIKLLYNPLMKSAYNFVPGVMGLVLMLICAMMTSISIVQEKERGTMEVLLVSPMKPIFIILAKAIPYLVLSFLNLISILLLSVFVLKVPMAGSLVSFFFVSFLFIMVALSLGLLISTIVDNQISAMLASGMVLMMPVIILSGMIFPVESMPVILRWISNIIPARWYIEAVKKIMIEGLSITYAMKESVILFSMAVVLILVSFKKFKYRLE